MCGRFVSPDTTAIERAWNIGRGQNPFAEVKLAPRRFNVQPTTNVTVILRERDSAELVWGTARWGLIPTWWKAPKPPRFTHNARSEEAAAKSMWQRSYRAMRCLIPAEGWYEWPEKDDIDTTTGEITQIGQPHYIYAADRRPVCFAGLFSPWTSPDGTKTLLTCAILTQAASPSVAAVHDRMPVILPEAEFATWTDPALSDTVVIADTIRAKALRDFVHHAVSKKINSGKNEGQELTEPSQPATKPILAGVSGSLFDEMGSNSADDPVEHARLQARERKGV